MYTHTPNFSNSSMDYGNDLTRLLRSGKNTFATGLFLVSFTVERHLSFKAQLWKGFMSFRLTSQFIRIQA